MLDPPIAELESHLNDVRKKRRATTKRIAIKDIPEDQRPQLIAPARTQFLNTIRIAAYRAETALAGLLREHLVRHDDARALLQDLFTHDADLIPDHQAKTLTVRLHHFTNPQASQAINAMLDGLNQTETNYPGTNLTLRYEMVSSPSPVGQEV